MNNVEKLETFIKVVEAESFSGAAKKLKITKSAVSKNIQILEDRLGIRLLNRTTRKLSLTEAGALYYQKISKIMQDIDEAERSIANLDKNPKGTLKINAPMTFGIMHLGKAISEFLLKYPEIKIELDLNDRLVNIVEEGFDVVIRIATLTDSSLIARKIANCPINFYASPKYLKNYGEPKEPKELVHHRILEFTNNISPGVFHYKSADDVGYVSYSSCFKANNGDILKQLAIAGIGLVMLPNFIVGNEVKNKSLKMIMKKYSADPERNIYAVFPQNRYLSAKVRVFVDFLSDYFGKNPNWL